MSYDLKVYDDDRNELETIRGLTLAQKDTIMQVLSRAGVKAQAFDGTGNPAGATNMAPDNLDPS